MEVLRQYSNATIRRRFLLHEASTFAELRSLPPLSPRFTLLTAFDVDAISLEQMHHTAHILIDRGLVYACCWGADCERWHDAIDHEDIALMQEHGEYSSSNNDCVMTTWHAKESLTDAIWYFQHCVEPTEGYAESCQDFIIVAAPQYAATVRSCFHER